VISDKTVFFNSLNSISRTEAVNNKKVNIEKYHENKGVKKLKCKILDD